jgi:signal transduction histidine kinase
LNDVSLITRLEDGSQLISIENVNINNILQEISEELKVFPPEERLELHAQFKEEVTLAGNNSLIGSIFSNLTENAIAYSGGRNIYISLLENTEKLCRIRFEDDGQGVDPKHLSRLFERFYRIDKGRSRKLGGTGLGLSIVKHAVLFHGGTITASNSPEGGLRFDFTLMKRQDNEK